MAAEVRIERYKGKVIEEDDSKRKVHLKEAVHRCGREGHMAKNTACAVENVRRLVISRKFVGQENQHRICIK